MRAEIQRARESGKTVGVVPTMGALHEGHLSLVDLCRAECDICVVTIFVNPTQFGPHEDFDRYPRDLDGDVEMLAERNVDLVFAPTPASMYDEQYSTSVQPPAAAEKLDGECRPGHFEGVATIVLKLFMIVPAHRAYFGQKDYQQTVVVKNMVRDLNVPVEIVVGPTVREADGLALSSRNRYLSATERQIALSISRSLRATAEKVSAGYADAPTLTANIREELTASGVDSIDYVTIVDPQTLTPVDEISEPAVALIAAHVGNTRLIDNWILTPKP